MVGPDNSVRANQRATQDLLAGVEVAIACLARIGPDRGEEIPSFRPCLGNLPPALDVRGSPPWGRVSIILSREGADRVCLCSDGGRVAVSVDFASESGTSAYSHSRGRECRRRANCSALLKPFHEGSFRGLLARLRGLDRASVVGGLHSPPCQRLVASRCRNWTLLAAALACGIACEIAHRVPGRRGEGLNRRAPPPNTADAHPALPRTQLPQPGHRPRTLRRPTTPRPSA